MSKKSDDSTRQLAFDFSNTMNPGAETNLPATQEPANVVSFVDAATLAVRRDAIKRVQASGIFALPSESRLEA